MQNKISLWIILEYFIGIMMITMQNDALPLRNLHFTLSKLPIYTTVAWGDTNILQAPYPVGPEGTQRTALSISFMQVTNNVKSI